MVGRKEKVGSEVKVKVRREKGHSCINRGNYKPMESGSPVTEEIRNALRYVAFLASAALRIDPIMPNKGSSMREIEGATGLREKSTASSMLSTLRSRLLGTRAGAFIINCWLLVE